MSKKILIIAQLSSILFSCGSSSYDKRSNTTIKSQLDREIVRELSDKTPCEKDSTEHHCEMITIGFNSGDYSETKYKVLVIENGGLLPSLTSYRKRVFAHAKMDENGFYRYHEPEIVLPRGAAKILYDLRGGRVEAKASDVSTQTLYDFEDIYADQISEDYLGHGQGVFNILAEYTEDTGFAIANHTLPRQHFCRLDYDGLTSYMDNASLSLKDFIKDNGIQFINLSAGESVPFYKRVWKSWCPNVQMPSDVEINKFLGITKTYYKTLANIPGVTLVQAGSNTTHNQRDYPVDCIDEGFTNRIRASYVNALESDIDEFGLSGRFGDTSRYIDTMHRGSKCIDIYLNSGIDESRRPFKYGSHPMMTTDFGIGLIEHYTKMTTSFIAPLATAYAIFIYDTENLESHDEQDKIGEVIKNIMNNDGNTIVRDPLKHKQFIRK